MFNIGVCKLTALIIKGLTSLCANMVNIGGGIPLVFNIGVFNLATSNIVVHIAMFSIWELKTEAGSANPRS